MENELHKILKSTRDVVPRAEFRERSRRLILASAQKDLGIFEKFRAELKENITVGLALTLATLLIFIIVGGYAYFGKPNMAVSNEEELAAEADRITFSIQLGEAQYFAESAEEMAVFLNELKAPETNKDQKFKKIIF